MKPFKQLAQTLAVAATLLIAQPIQAETFYFHNDHLGTPQVLTDDSGTVVWQGSYKPFGEVTETTATVEQNIRFPGQYFEEETGLHYNYFRDYDPGTGRYIESDPIGLGGGVNTFGYGYQSPFMNVDPTGEFGVVSGIIVVGGICYAFYTLFAGTDSCADRYPNHKLMGHPDRRLFLQCIAAVGGIVGQGAGLATDPIGSAASAAGGAIGEKVACENNKCE